NYHAYEFSEDEYGIAYEFSRRLEKRRPLDWCHDVPSGGPIGALGAGGGCHLRILRDCGDPTWRRAAAAPDASAAGATSAPRIQVHRGFLDEVGLPPDSYDFAMMIVVVEHVDDPAGILRSVHRILRPGGRVGIVTDNIRSVDARLGRRRHWGGYHFPRHFNL